MGHLTDRAQGGIVLLSSLLIAGAAVAPPASFTPEIRYVLAILGAFGLSLKEFAGGKQ